jgi:choice-of-anchor B domain-containing protein
MLWDYSISQFRTCLEKGKSPYLQTIKVYMKSLSQLFTLISFLLLSHGAVAQPCENGLAGNFPCEFIDQLSFIDLDVFEAVNTNDVWGWTSPETGREYVLMGADNKTAFIDISSPEYPIYLGYLPTRTVPSLWRDVKVIGHYAYVVSEAFGHGLQVFDLRRLENLTAADIPFVFDSDVEYLEFGNSHNVVVDEVNDYVFGVGTQTFAGGPHIVDVADPLNPVFAGGSSEAGYSHDAQVVVYNGPDTEHLGKEILLGFNEEIVAVYDITNKLDIELISATGYDNVGYVHQGWFTEDHRYMISNDELDERNDLINTRPILWDMTDLDNPEVIGYVDLGTFSVDHNLYIKDDLVYMSNYMSGFRVLDIIDIAQGHLEPTGFFDVIPQIDNVQFQGSWSNYPYFESGVIPVTNMYVGLHILKPSFFELENDVVKVCDQSGASLSFSINRRLNGTVNYSVEMQNNVIGTNPSLLFDETDGAPAENAILWTNLSQTPAGSYPGEFVVEYEGGEERFPFVLIKEDGGDVSAPELLLPDGEVLLDQEVNFSFTDDAGSYLTLQVALDAEFQNIVYEEVIYGGSGNISAEMPFRGTAYFWRIIKESACGDPLVSEVQQFTIDITASIAEGELRAESFAIFPNPTNGIVNLRFSEVKEPFEYLEILDLSGRVLKEIPFQSPRELVSFDVSNLSDGVYLVRIPGTGIAEQFIKR